MKQSEVVSRNKACSTEQLLAGDQTALQSGRHLCGMLSKTHPGHTVDPPAWADTEFDCYVLRSSFVTVDRMRLQLAKL